MSTEFTTKDDGVRSPVMFCSPRYEPPEPVRVEADPFGSYHFLEEPNINCVMARGGCGETPEVPGRHRELVKCGVGTFR